MKNYFIRSCMALSLIVLSSAACTRRVGVVSTTQSSVQQNSSLYGANALLEPRATQIMLATQLNGLTFQVRAVPGILQYILTLKPLRESGREELYYSPANASGKISFTIEGLNTGDTFNYSFQGSLGDGSLVKLYDPSLEHAPNNLRDRVRVGECDAAFEVSYSRSNAQFPQLSWNKVVGSVGSIVSIESVNQIGRSSTIKQVVEEDLAQINELVANESYIASVANICGNTASDEGASVSSPIYQTFTNAL